jgi:hypothetical protein
MLLATMTEKSYPAGPLQKRAQTAHRLGARLDDLVDAELGAALAGGDAEIDHAAVELRTFVEEIGDETRRRGARDQGVNHCALSAVNEAACRAVARIGAGEAGLGTLRNPIVRARAIPGRRGSITLWNGITVVYGR